MEPEIYGEALEFYHSLLEGNRRFADEKQAQDPEFFARLARGQTPKVLWIGCSDSRVASDIITNTEPGTQFVHRNVANLVVHTDMNILSAIQFAVQYLRVEHIIVCGHYGCGGVLAAMQTKPHGLIDNWLRNIRDVYRLHHVELDQIADLGERADRLIELNVVEQVYNVCKTTVVQNAWKNHQLPYVHGWVYSLETGRIKDLHVDIHEDSEISKFYSYDVDNSLR